MRTRTKGTRRKTQLNHGAKQETRKKLAREEVVIGRIKEKRRRGKEKDRAWRN